MGRRYDYYDDYYWTPSKPIEVEGGIKARSKRGDFAKNWWATRWIKALERLVDSGRLSRGRTYARKGQVLSIEETKNGVKARVQGSRSRPYKVTIEVKPLSDGEWEQVIDALADRAIFAAQLLAGEMPGDIEEAFASAGVGLFPEKPGDLNTECSCPDWANPCKHVAATHYILGEQFDEDPFLLFRMRGRSREQVLEALRVRRAGMDEADEMDDEPEEAPPPLDETLPHFWEMGETLEHFPVSIKPPPVDMPILKRLGEPAFMGRESLQGLLAPAYRSITDAVVLAAFGGDAEQETPD